jgi:hypothetical protein
MRESYVIRAPNGEYKLDGKRFLKELLREGSYQHPTQPWDEDLVVDEAKIDELVANSLDGLDHGVKIPFPVNHQDMNDPEKNRGFTTTLFKKQNPSGSLSLYGEIDVVNEETAGKIGTELQDVSVYIAGWGSGQWKPDGERVVHVALTNYPVAAGMENFVALSGAPDVDSKLNVPVLRRLAVDQRKNTMKIPSKLREVAKGLGVELVGDELDEKSLTAFAERVAVATKPIKADAPTPEILLSVDVEKNSYFSKYHEQKNAKAESDVEAAEKAGKLNKDMAEAAKTLLGVGHGYALSAEGKAEAVDVPTLVHTLLSGIPDKAVVNVDDRVSDADLARSTAGSPEVKPKQFSAEDLKATKDRILSNVNPSKDQG